MTVQATKVQKQVIPDKKPEGGIGYSTSKPVKTNFLSPDARTRIFQFSEELEKQAKIIRMVVDNSDQAKSCVESIMRAAIGISESVADKK